MNIDTMRRLDRTAGSLACRLLSLLPAPEPVPGMRPQKILVILLSEMGSLVLARPMFRRIRELHPGAEIFALLFARNQEALELLNEVEPGNIIPLRDTTLAAFAADSLAALKRIRRLKIDTVLDCELFARISAIFSRFSGAAIRAGFHPHTQEGLYRGDFLNRPVLYNPYLHMSRQFLNLLAAVSAPSRQPRVKDIADQEEVAPCPDLIFPEKEKEVFLARFLESHPALAGKRMVLLSPGGGLLPIRAWPGEHYAAVARELTAGGFGVGIIGLGRDKAVAEKIVSACPGGACVDLTGATRTLRELLLLFSAASLLITNDGGPGHFATLVSLPAIVLFGPETPVLYGPPGKRNVNLFAPTACAPCLTAYNHRTSPCDGNNLCLRSITPKQVLAHAHDLLATT